MAIYSTPRRVTILVKNGILNYLITYLKRLHYLLTLENVCHMWPPPRAEAHACILSLWY